MLPSIMHVAERFHLESDPNTYGKKESRFKCPFCEQDSLPENQDKYYLSLNIEDNLFKCWFCDKSGGVLQFESLLSQKPYEEIREKYFGKRKRDLHPAYRLSPDQLKQIGWQSKKRDDFKGFSKQKEQVIEDWKEYKLEELARYYALFNLITHFPIKEKRKKHYEWFKKICQNSKVNNLSKKIIQQWNSPKKEDWANEGQEIARISYLIAYEYADFEFHNLFSNILFIQELRKIKKIKEENGGKTSVSI